MDGDGTNNSTRSSTAQVRVRQLCLWDGVEELADALSDEERLFADAYLGYGVEVERAFSVTLAYQRVRPSAKRGTARKVGRDWLQREAVRAYIDAVRRRMAREADLTREEIIGDLREVRDIGLGRMTVRKTLYGKDGLPVGEVEVREPNLTAANTALGTMSKFVGVLDDDPAPRAIEVRFVAAEDAGGGGADPDRDA